LKVLTIVLSYVLLKAQEKQFPFIVSETIMYNCTIGLLFG